jgi:hypothetical protein
MAAESHFSGRKNWPLLIQALVLASLLSGVGVLLYFFFGENIVILFFGDNYRESGAILKWYGLAMFPMSIAMVTEHFLIAQGRVLFAYLFLFVAPIQLIALKWNHENTSSVLYIMGAGSSALSILGLGFLWRTYIQDGRFEHEGSFRVK